MRGKLGRAAFTPRVVPFVLFLSPIVRGSHTVEQHREMYNYCTFESWVLDLKKRGGPWPYSAPTRVVAQRDRRYLDNGI